MADILTWDIKGTKQLIKQLQKAGALAPQALADAMNVESELIVTSAKQALRAGYPAPTAGFDVGTLAGTGHVAQYARMTGGYNMETKVAFGGPAAPYALYLHEGTGPAVGRPRFNPPVHKFYDWAGRQLGDRSKASIIAATVGSRGLKPRKYLEIPWKAAVRGMAGRLAKRVKAAIEAHLNKGGE